MIRHLFKLVWNRKRTNLLIVAEIFVSFLVVFSLTASVLFFYDRYRRPARVRVPGRLADRRDPQHGGGLARPGRPRTP